MDLYILLGVERVASRDEIKRAYKRLARRYHPDINPGDRTAAQHFRQIAEAYETLSDPDRRQHYDTAGPAVASSADPVAFGFEGFDFSVSVIGSSAPTFGDLFAETLRRSAGAAGRGVDLHHTLLLRLEDAIRGGPHEIALTRQEPCRVCAGVGHLQSAARPCGACQGTGSVRSTRGHMVFAKPCASCDGSGVQASIRCGACGGRQVEMRAETVRLHAPPGVADGDQMRVPGKGHAGGHTGEAGDLFVTFRVEPHPVFRREGEDLHVRIPIAVHEAALGAKVDVPALDGHGARIRVLPGTASGQRFRLHERGVVSMRGGPRGDLVVEVTIVLPKRLDERSKELLREFGRLNDDDVRRDLLGK